MGTFHQQTNTALISVIPKKGKDLTECSNYRPISLIGTDIKLYSKVFALRLERLIEKLVHPDQSGFIPKRHAADNIRRLLHVRAFSHIPRLVRTFGLFSLIRTKIKGVKPPPDHGPDQKTKFWSDKKRWSRSGPNWTMIRFICSVKAFLGWFGLSDQIQESLAGSPRVTRPGKLL